DLVGVLGVQADGPGVDAGELLEQQGLALHHRQGGGRADFAGGEDGPAGGAAAGPMLPRQSTAEPSVTTATVLRLMVSRRASVGLAAIAWQTLATPGGQAMERAPRG